MIDAADDVFRKATELAASALVQGGKRIMEVKGPEPKVPTVYLQPTMREALSKVSGCAVDQVEEVLPLPNWDPKPRGPDIRVRASPDAWWVAELKMRKTDETLWDLLKMADALRLTGIQAAYLVVGATERQWRKSGACTEIFGDDGLENYSIFRLFDDNKRAWWNLLHGGTARPIETPAAITTRPVAKCELPVDGKAGWLKCVAVETGGSETIQFRDEWHHGNWPIGVDPGPEYFAQPPKTGAHGFALASSFDRARRTSEPTQPLAPEIFTRYWLKIPNRLLREVDLPDANDRLADGWDELALSFPGYRYRADVDERTKAALARWKRGEDPEGSLSDVRSWLFFEQRQDHMAGAVSDWGWVLFLIERIRAELRAQGRMQDERGWEPEWEAAPVTVESADASEWFWVQHDVDRRFPVVAVAELEDRRLAVSERDGVAYVIRSSTKDHARTGAEVRRPREITTFVNTDEARAYIEKAR